MRLGRVGGGQGNWQGALLLLELSSHELSEGHLELSSNAQLWHEPDIAMDWGRPRTSLALPEHCKFFKDFPVGALHYRWLCLWGLKRPFTNYFICTFYEMYDT